MKEGGNLVGYSQIRQKGVYRGSGDGIVIDKTAEGKRVELSA